MHVIVDCVVAWFDYLDWYWVRKGGVKAPHFWNKGVEKGDIMVGTVESLARD